MANPNVLIETSKGDILVELFADKAPISVENFLRYVDEEHYEGTIFHRVIGHFMIQGGGMDGMLKEKETHAPIKNEAENGLKNDAGTLAMARTMEVDSATSQFFINVVDNAFLNHTAPSPEGFGYCVFGKVIDGMETVEKIRKVRTTTKGMHADVPVDEIYINSVSRFE